MFVVLLSRLAILFSLAKNVLSGRLSTLNDVLATTQLISFIIKGICFKVTCSILKLKLHTIAGMSVMAPLKVCIMDWCITSVTCCPIT